MSAVELVASCAIRIERGRRGDRVWARPERHAVDYAIAARSGHRNGLRGRRHSPELGEV